MKIGWGKREYSLDEPVNLYGQMYIRLSEGILDPLYATALCVDGGKGQDAVVFCSCDMANLQGTALVEETRQKVRELCPDLPAEWIVMNATHTHCSGDLRDTPEKTPDGVPIYPGRKYRAYVVQKCAEAICEAWSTRSEGGIAYGYGYAVVGHSRRVVYTEDKALDSGRIAPNGRCVMYGNTADKSFSHYEAGADPTLNVMFTFDAGKN